MHLSLQNENQFHSPIKVIYGHGGSGSAGSFLPYPPKAGFVLRSFAVSKFESVRLRFEVKCKQGIWTAPSRPGQKRITPPLKDASSRAIMIQLRNPPQPIRDCWVISFQLKTTTYLVCSRGDQYRCSLSYIFFVYRAFEFVKEAWLESFSNSSLDQCGSFPVRLYTLRCSPHRLGGWLLPRLFLHRFPRRESVFCCPPQRSR